MVERIDAFAHILPREFYREIADAHPTDELQIYREMDHIFDTAIENRLADMDDFGIDKHVLTLKSPTFWRGIDRDTALRLTRLANDEMAKIPDRHPDRFVATGTLPFLDGAFLDELDRCVTELGLHGIQTFSNIQGKPLDHPDFRDFYDRIEDHGVPLWIHPQLHDWYEWDSEYMLHKLFGWPFDTSMAIGRLVYSGILAEHPQLDVIAHHMGGMIPHFRERIRSITQMNQADYPYRDPDLGRPAIDQFRDIYADTALYGDPASLASGYDFFGSNRLVFVVDYPNGPEKGRQWIGDTIEAIDAMDIDDAARQRIFADNIRELLDL